MPRGKLKRIIGITCIAVIVILVGRSGALLAITQIKYNSIHIGATYKEVTSILGRPFTQMESENQILEADWELAGGVIALNFDQGKVYHKKVFLNRKGNEVSGSTDPNLIKVIDSN